MKHISPSEALASLWYDLKLVCGNFFFKFRNALFPTVFVLMFLFTRPALFLGNETLDRLVVLLGVLIALSGQIFRLSVIGYAYIKRGGKDGKVFADKLVIRGFYAHTRNPMYVGNFLIAVGIGIVYGSPWIYFAVIPFFTFVYLAITTAEEAYLSKQFGAEYDDYVKRVNRFIPNFQGLRKTLSEFKYDWKRALRKDYGTVFGTLAGILIILIWKLGYVFGFREKGQEILWLILAMIPVGSFYGIVRYMKLNGRLASPND